MPDEYDPPTSAAASGPGPRAAHAGPLGLNERIGAYRLLSVLGEGGFGVVYGAERTEPFVQKVAVKVLKPGMDSRAIVARFEQERQALAVMDHPGIARVLDGGLTNEGRPYFVMELVEGEPITQFCASRRVGLADRLSLFVQVCEAVQHAHMKGVIHRDIKPSNVLVAMIGGKPTPKVIDFGIAKAMAGSLTDKTLFTERGQFIGTPEYMSPEQADGTSDVDTRTDVYALGVLLYELLTGELPFTSEELRRAGFAEVLRIIREVDPPKPSTRVSEAARTGVRSGESETLPAPSSLVRQLRGDLDWIVMRALEKSRARRYESPGSLAADIKRHLRTEPVEAGPPSASYRLAKFVRRRKALVAAMTISLLAIMIGLALAIHGMNEARRERNDAIFARDSERRAREDAEAQRSAAELARSAEKTAREVAEKQRVLAEEARDAESQQRNRAQAAATFITDAVNRSNPYLEQRNISLVDLLQDMTAELDLRAGSDRMLDADVRRMIGGTFRALGRPKEAEGQLNKAIDVLTADKQTTSERYAETVVALATVMNDLSRPQAAMKLLDETLPMWESRTSADARRLTAELLATRSNSLRLMNKRADAEKALATALTLRTDVFGADSIEVADVHGMLSIVLAEQPGRTDEALAHANKALVIRQKKLGEPAPLVETSLHNIGRIQRERGDLAASIDAYTRSLEMSTRRGDTNSLHIARTRIALAVVLRDANRLDDAEAWAEKSVELFRRVLGPSVEVADALDVLAGINMDRGQTDAAIAQYREEISMLEDPELEAQAPLSRALTGLAGALMAAQDFAAAEEAAQRAWEIRTRIMPATDWRIFSTQSLLGAAKAERGDTAGAEPLLRTAAQAIWENPNLPAKRKRPVIERVVRMYELAEKPEDAAAWRERLKSLTP